jgi:hypothetical protein
MKTAVEFLMNEMPLIDWKVPYWKNKLEQAKEMEKEQLYNLIDFINERHFNSFRIAKDEVEQYYNETFKSE